MTKDKKIRMIVKQLNGVANKQENTDFSNWLLQDAENLDLFIEIKNIWNTAIVENKIFDEQKAKQKLHKAISSNKKKVKIKQYSWAIAASITILITLSIFTQDYFQNTKNEDIAGQTVNYITKQSKHGEQLRVTLPDASVVNLNTGSSITFPETFNSETRQIELYGEAFFSVTKNPECPFVISCNGITTTVIGTSFNIKNYNKNNFTITVASGKVKIEKQDSEQIYLLSNEQATYKSEDKHFNTKKVNASNYSTWMSGIIQFNDDSLDEAIKMMERWYNVEIQLKNKNHINTRITGKYKDKKLYTILDGLCYMYNLKYEYINDSTIVIN